MPDPAFAARPRLLRLRDALTRAAQLLRPTRWNEPAVFFFDRKRQAELEGARPATPRRFATLADLITVEMPPLLAHVEVRRVARALEGLGDAARAIASHCPVARDLVDLLAVPDDEVFLALWPDEEKGVQLHLRGVADVGQLHNLLLDGSVGFQLLTPKALLPDGTLPTGFAACEHWLWPTQPLAAIPRIGGERVVLVGPAVVQTTSDIEPRFPRMPVEAEVIQVLTPSQVAESLSRLTGHSVPIRTAVVPQAA